MIPYLNHPAQEFMDIWNELEQFELEYQNAFLEMEKEYDIYKSWNSLGAGLKHYRHDIENCASFTIKGISAFKATAILIHSMSQFYVYRSRKFEKDIPERLNKTNCLSSWHVGFSRLNREDTIIYGKNGDELKLTNPVNFPSPHFALEVITQQQKCQGKGLTTQTLALIVEALTYILNNNIAGK